MYDLLQKQFAASQQTKFGRTILLKISNQRGGALPLEIDRRDQLRSKKKIHWERVATGVTVQFNYSSKPMRFNKPSWMLSHPAKGRLRWMLSFTLRASTINYISSWSHPHTIEHSKCCAGLVEYRHWLALDCTAHTRLLRLTPPQHSTSLLQISFLDQSTVPTICQTQYFGSLAYERSRSKRSPRKSEYMAS